MSEPIKRELVKICDTCGERKPFYRFKKVNGRERSTSYTDCEKIENASDSTDEDSREDDN